MIQKVLLRQLTEKEYHSFFRGYVNDRMISSAVYQYSAEQVSRQYRYDQMRSGNTCVLGIIYKDTPVGMLSIDDMDHTEHTCRIGIILQNDNIKNKRIGTEAFGLGIEYAFRHYETKLISADTRSDNIAMRRILESYGFMLQETVDNAWGNGIARLVYVLPRSGYFSTAT